MAKYTLLDMTQKILSSMDSDEVNSIVDTTESMQVAQCIQQAYDAFVSLIDLPEHYTLFELNASGDISLPTVMTRPDNMKEVVWVQYDAKETEDGVPEFKQVKYLPPTDFLNYVYGFQADDPAVSLYNFVLENATVDLRYKNNKAPEFYTSFDDQTLIFDAFNSTIETTLKRDKTLCYGVKDANFILEDDFVAPLDDRQYNLFFNEAKALCHAELKQVQHAKAEKTARRGWIKLQTTKKAIEPSSALDNLPNYGRRR